jgi:hypothetical protein
MKDLVYTDKGSKNWLFEKYYFGGQNYRYFTFQLALNLLKQRHPNPIIIETGCQRMKDDLGAGMSTSIWGEYCQRYGGHLTSVDISGQNLTVCKECTAQYAGLITYIQSDSIAFLSGKRGAADLLYLDSLDYDYGGLLNIYGGAADINAAIKAVDAIPQDELLKKHSNIILPAQQHCLSELKAAEKSGIIKADTILMIDDNQLPGGGKSRLVKDYLASTGWTCLLDHQQTLWVRKL